MLIHHTQIVLGLPVVLVGVVLLLVLVGAGVAGFLLF